MIRPYTTWSDLTRDFQNKTNELYGRIPRLYINIYSIYIGVIENFNPFIDQERDEYKSNGATP